VVFNCNGSFTKAKKCLHDQATRAMYALINKCKKLMLPIDIQLQLFDSMVIPILTYGSEVWGFENLSIINKVYHKFLKITLGVNNNTCNNMVYGELGRFPIGIHIQVKMLNYWSRLVLGNENKLSYLTYKMMFELDKRGQCTFKWLNAIKDSLNNVGLGYVWLDQKPRNTLWLKKHVLEVLKCQFIQKWTAEVWAGSKCINYRICKTNLH